MTLYLLGPARSCDKLKATYIHPHNTYSDKLGRVVIYHDELLPKRHTTSWARGLARSRARLKPLHLQLLIANGQQTGQNGDLKILNAFVTWSCKITQQIETIISSLPQCLGPPKLAGWWFNLCGSYLFSQMTLPWITWSYQITWKTKNSIFLLPQYLWPKNSRLMTSNAELPLIKLHHPSIMRFCEVTWQIKYFLSPLVLDQWPPNMVRWWLPVRVLHP